MSHFADPATHSMMPTSSAGTTRPMATDDRVGAWVRLPCCDHTVHPVNIVGQRDGIIIISRPSEPHPEWVKFPDRSSTVAVGWSDEDGTLGFFCNALGETKEGNWALQIVSANDFAQRRRHVRVRTDATVHLMDVSLLRPVEMKLIDISESGMKCELVEFIPEKRILPYQFALKLEGATLLLLAELRWSSRINPIVFHAAFEFIEIHEDSLRRLRAHVMQQLARQQMVD